MMQIDLSSTTELAPQCSASKGTSDYFHGCHVTASMGDSAMHIDDAGILQHLSCNSSS